MSGHTSQHSGVGTRADGIAEAALSVAVERASRRVRLLALVRGALTGAAAAACVLLAVASITRFTVVPGGWTFLVVLALVLPTGWAIRAARFRPERRAVAAALGRALGRGQGFVAAFEALEEPDCPAAVRHFLARATVRESSGTRARSAGFDCGIRFPWERAAVTALILLAAVSVLLVPPIHDAVGGVGEERGGELAMAGRGSSPERRDGRSAPARGARSVSPAPAPDDGSSDLGGALEGPGASRREADPSGSGRNGVDGRDSEVDADGRSARDSSRRLVGDDSGELSGERVGESSGGGDIGRAQGSGADAAESASREGPGRTEGSAHSPGDGSSAGPVGSERGDGRVEASDPVAAFRPERAEGRTAAPPAAGPIVPLAESYPREFRAVVARYFRPDA